MMADELDMNKETVRNIIVQDLGMRVDSEAHAAKLDGRNKRTEISLVRGLCGTTSRTNFLDRVFTADETWCYQYDHEAKEATDVKVQDQNNVHLLFRHQGYHPLF
jgi:hypothetical protein